MKEKERKVYILRRAGERVWNRVAMLSRSRRH